VRDTKLANDGPCPGITSQGITALLDAGRPSSDAAVQTAASWLLTQQRPDGTFENLWYRDFTTGTAVALAALARAGYPGHPVAQRARQWLLDSQLADGGWGPGPQQADAPAANIGSVKASVEETAWALHALIEAAVPVGSEPVRRGIRWLLAAQLPDGSWQPSRICVYIRHHMNYPNGAIAQGLALRALGLYAERSRETRPTDSAEAAR